MSSSQLIFPINICLCAEERAAVRLMIRITAACCPATPAACWELNSLRGLRSVTHTPPHTPLPSPTCISHRHSIGGMLSANDRCLAPPSFSFSSVSSLSRSRAPSISDIFFFKHHAASLRVHTPQICTHTHLRASLTPYPAVIWRREVERCLIYNQGGSAPSPPPPPPPLPSRCEH